MTVELLDSKTKKSISELYLIKVFDRYGNMDNVMAEATMIVKQELIQVEDIPMRNSPTEILSSKNISEV